MGAVKFSDLVSGAEFPCTMGIVKIVEIVKDGYGTGDHEYRCTVNDHIAKENNVEPFTFADGKQDLKSFINISGWEYWIKKQKEPNYAQVTVAYADGVNSLTKHQILTLEKRLFKVVERVQQIILKFKN